MVTNPFHDWGVHICASLAWKFDPHPHGNLVVEQLSQKTPSFGGRSCSQPSVFVGMALHDPRIGCVSTFIFLKSDVVFLHHLFLSFGHLKTDHFVLPESQAELLHLPTSCWRPAQHGGRLRHWRTPPLGVEPWKNGEITQSTMIECSWRHLTIQLFLAYIYMFLYVLMISDHLKLKLDHLWQLSKKHIEAKLDSTYT